MLLICTGSGEHFGQVPLAIHQCRWCNIDLLKEDMPQHLQDVHDDFEAPHDCPHCDKPLEEQNFNGLIERYADLERERSYQCSQCTNAFFGDEVLKRHADTTHDPNRSRLYGCGKCEKTFFTLEHSQQHQLVHSGKRAYEYEICSAKFKSNHHLATHVKRRPRLGGKSCGNAKSD